MLKSFKFANQFKACILIVEFIMLIACVLHYNRAESYIFNQEDLLLHLKNESDPYGPDSYTPGFYVDHDTSNGLKVSSSLMNLRKGIYSITVNYSTNADDNWHTCYTTLTSEVDRKDLSSMVDCDHIALSQDRPTLTYCAWVRHGSEYRVVLGPSEDASGDGIYVLVDSISVTYLTKRTIIHETFKLLLSFILLDLCLYVGIYKREKFLEYIKGKELVWGVGLFIVVFACYPLFYRKQFFGDDIFYHLKRIAYLSEGLRNGSFPVKIQPGWNYGYGYAAGVGYGDLLLYPSAILMLLGYTLQFAYKFYIFLTTAICVLCSYHAYKRISGNANIGIMCAGIYTLMGFRLHSVDSGATVGEFGAYTFLPIVILGLWYIYNRGKKNGYIVLAAGIALTLSCHVLSTFILAMVIPLFCLLMIERTVQKDIFLDLVKALLLAVGLSAYFLVPLIDYMLFQNMNGPIFSNLAENGQEFVNLFINLKDPTTNSGGWSGLGLYSLVILCGAIGFLITGRFKNKGSAYIRLMLLTFLLIYLCVNSSFYFILMDKATPIYNVIKNMQFPWHFLNVVSGLVVFWAAVLLKEIRNDVNNNGLIYPFCAILVALLIVQSGDLIREVVVEGNPITCFDVTSITGVWSAEFDISGSSVVVAKAEQGMIVRDDDPGVASEIAARKGTTIYAKTSNPTDHSVIVEAPLWGYRYYKAKCSQGLLKVSMTDTKKLAVEVPAGFDDTIKIYFHEPWYWRLSEVMTLVVLGGAVYLWRRKIK